MATDRQTPCSYYFWERVCIKAGKPIIPDCQTCNEYEPDEKNQYKNKIKEEKKKFW